MNSRVHSRCASSLSNFLRTKKVLEGLLRIIQFKIFLIKISNNCAWSWITVLLILRFATSTSTLSLSVICRKESVIYLFVYDNFRKLWLVIFIVISKCLKNGLNFNFFKILNLSFTDTISEDNDCVCQKFFLVKTKEGI